MSPITGSIEIARAPQDVFDYATDLKRQGEWQEAIVDIEVETEGPTRVGTKASETRKVPGGTRTHVDFEMEFHGHGLGVLLLPIVNRDAKKLVPKDLALLKQRLESAS